MHHTLDEIAAYILHRVQDGRDEVGPYVNRPNGWGTYGTHKEYLPTFSRNDDGIRATGEGEDLDISVCWLHAMVHCAWMDTDERYKLWRLLRLVFTRAYREAEARRVYSFDAVDFEKVLEDIGGTSIEGYNTYNDADTPINTSVNYVCFQWRGENWMIARIHVGLDVRAGYSAWAVLPNDQNSDNTWPFVWPTLYWGNGIEEYPFSSFFGEHKVEIEKDESGAVLSIKVDGEEASIYSGVTL